MKKNILIAEDDKDIVEILNLYLVNAGYEVDSAGDGAEAIEKLRRGKFDLLIADIMMPVMDGYELIRTIREDRNMPIIILSAKGRDAERIIGLNIGADAYISKPFNPLEVVAYVDALCRRYFALGANNTAEEVSNIMKSGDLELDMETRSLSKNGEPIRLTRIEYQILLLLMKNPGKIFTVTQLFENLEKSGIELDINSLRVHILNLRSKVEDNPSAPVHIKNVRGIGYKFEK